MAAYHLRQELSYDDIVTLAERDSGAVGFNDEALRGRVRTLVELVNGHGPYTPDQVRAMSDQIRVVLARRLRMLLDRQRLPGIAQEKIERPIFIIGFPRSGTTLIHSLLAEDPEMLAPQSWQVCSPSPPPGAGPVVPERTAYAQRMVEKWMDFCPAQKQMHPYTDKGAWQLNEDEEVVSLDFRNTYCYHFYRIPTLDRHTVLDDDPVGAFRFHREFLQHFQWNTGKSRWACKGPSHQGNLAPLFEVYPDALCIWAHRPMVEIFASIVSLTGTVYDTITGRPNDIKETARTLAEVLKGGFDHIMANELVDDPRVMHVPFSEVSSDPIGFIGRIYDRQGMEVTAEFRERMRAWLEAPENRVDRFGRYPYSYEALGLDRQWVDELFADYSKRFGLA